MVMYPHAPFTAAQLICEESAIQASLRSIEWKGDLLKPSLELHVPWHGVVVHGNPAKPLWDAWTGNGQDIWDNLLQDNGILPGNVKDVRMLCQDEEAELKEQISLWLMFEDARYSIMESFCLAQSAGCSSIVTTNRETKTTPLSHTCSTTCGFDG